MMRFAPFACIAFLCILASTAFASARDQSVDHGGTYWGNVIVEQGQVVDGDVTVIGGDATIAGTVNGDVNVVGGDIVERPGATITGHVNTVGGDIARTIVPWVPSGMARSAFHQDMRVLWKLAWAVVVVLAFLIFPVRTRMALGRLETHPGLCALFGLFGWVAIFPLAVLLLCTIVLIPLIPVEFVALAAAYFVGKAALAFLVGRRFYELLQPHATPAPLGALVFGLVLITAAELVPVIGVLVSMLVGLVAVGAVALTFVTEHALTPSTPSQRPPLGGPPIPAG